MLNLLNTWTGDINWLDKLLLDINIYFIVSPIY